MSRFPNNYVESKRPDKKCIRFHLYKIPENANWSLVMESKSVVSRGAKGKDYIGNLGEI